MYQGEVIQDTAEGEWEETKREPTHDSGVTRGDKVTLFGRGEGRKRGGGKPWK
jgi:hypothetical protein